MGAFFTVFGSGSASYADASDVRFGVDRGDGVTGTLVLPALSDVRLGVSYGASGEYTGSLIVGYVDAAPSTMFQRGMHRGHLVAQRTFADVWIYEGTTFPAISIDRLSAEELAMRGGRFRDATVIVQVREAIWTASAAAPGKVITVRGERVRILVLDDAGDGARDLGCGPVGIDAPRR